METKLSKIDSCKTYSTNADVFCNGNDGSCWSFSINYDFQNHNFFKNKEEMKDYVKDICERRGVEYDEDKLFPVLSRMEKYVTEITKKSLVEWLQEVRDRMHSVYAVCNGGGISLFRSDQIDGLIADITDEDEYGDIEILSKGEEYEDFKDVMSKKEYYNTDVFIQVNHLTGYNQPNLDYQIQYYSI